MANGRDFALSLPQYGKRERSQYLKDYLLFWVFLIESCDEFIVLMGYSKRIRGTTPEIESAARWLRKNMTTAEQKLWSALKDRQLDGFKFRAQHPVGRFIVDFYCPACRLMIEVDGAIHSTRTDYDVARTDQLKSYGYTVIRFTNDEVIHHLLDVLNSIRQIITSLKLE